MHEVSLVAALLEQVEAVALKEKFKRVLEIRLEVGALSGVDPECLEFCFSEVVQDSVLAGSRLSLESVSVEIDCAVCGARSRPEDLALLLCSSCQSPRVKICRGRDFRIIDLEVE